MGLDKRPAELDPLGTMKRMKWHVGMWMAVASVCAMAQIAEAGYRISYEAISYSSMDGPEQEDTRQKNVMLIDGGRFRTVGGDVAGFDLIADVTDTRLFILDSYHNSYAMVPFVLQPSETDPPSGSSELDIRLDESGPMMLKHPTRHYSIYEDSTLIREIWTTDDLEMGFDFMQAMDGMERAFQEISPSEDYEEFSTVFRQVRGVPLRDVQYYPYGRDVLEAVRIDRVKIRPEEFLPPSGYVEKALSEILETDAPGAPSESPVSTN